MGYTLPAACPGSGRAPIGGARPDALIDGRCAMCMRFFTLRMDGNVPRHEKERPRGDAA